MENENLSINEFESRIKAAIYVIRGGRPYGFKMMYFLEDQDPSEWLAKFLMTACDYRSINDEIKPQCRDLIKHYSEEIMWCEDQILADGCLDFKNTSGLINASRSGYCFHFKLLDTGK
jgi:hypothetical protein